MLLSAMARMCAVFGSLASLAAATCVSRSVSVYFCVHIYGSTAATLLRLLVPSCSGLPSSPLPSHLWAAGLSLSTCSAALLPACWPLGLFASELLLGVWLRLCKVMLLYAACAFALSCSFTLTCLDRAALLSAPALFSSSPGEYLQPTRLVLPRSSALLPPPVWVSACSPCGLRFRALLLLALTCLGEYLQPMRFALSRSPAPYPHLFR